MALVHTHKWYAIEDAQIAKLTDDPAGGAPTYGALIDVPGIKGIDLRFDVQVAELRGDNQLLDVNAKVVGITATIQHAKMNFDLLPVWFGGTVTDSGVTPDQVADYGMLGSDVPQHWKLEGATPENGIDVIGGDGHLILHKCMLGGGDIGFAEENYKIPGIEARAIPLTSNNKWWNVVANETVAAIA